MPRKERPRVRRPEDKTIDLEICASARCSLNALKLRCPAARMQLEFAHNLVSDVEKLIKDAPVPATPTKKKPAPIAAAPAEAKGLSL